MSNFYVDLSELAKNQLNLLVNDFSKKSVSKAVVKSLKYMRTNIRHPSLHTHKFNEMKGPNGEEVFESYAQNKTPGAYRIFWIYGPGKSIITVLSITSHP